MTPLTDGQTPILMPTQKTNTVTATATAMTNPSFSLIDGIGVERPPDVEVADVDVADVDVAKRAVHDERLSAAPVDASEPSSAA